MQQKSIKPRKLKNDRKRTQNIIIKMPQQTYSKTLTSSTSKKAISDFAYCSLFLEIRCLGCIKNIVRIFKKWNSQENDRKPWLVVS